MLNTGYILLHRSITEWEWYTDQNVKSVFLHLLLTANYYDQKWHGTVIKRGQRAASLRDLSDELGLSVDKVRTALNKLERTTEITRSKIGKIGLITVINYDKYQRESHENPTEIPTFSQRNPNVIPPNKENKESNKAGGAAHGREDVAALCQEYEKQFGSLPRIVAEEFAKSIAEGVQPDLIKRAIAETAKAEAKSPIRYIQSILARCKAANITTAEQFEQSNGRGAVPGRGAGRAVKPSCAGYDLAEIEKRIMEDE